MLIERGPFPLLGGFILNKEQIISEVLAKCQNNNKSLIVGGYIRNKLLGYDFKDVDILTTCPPQKLKQLFPQLTWTDQGINLGITRMIYKGIEFDFTSSQEEEFEEKLKNRDFTVNSFYFDGQQVMAQASASKDIANRCLRPLADLKTKMDFSPQTFIRAFRFVSLYDLKWTDELITGLKENIDYFSKIPNGRLQSEAYDMLKGENIVRSLYYYEQLRLISPNNKLNELKDLKVPLYNQNLGARLIYLSYLLGETTIIEWIRLHHLSVKLIEEIQEYLPYLSTEQKFPPKKLPFITLLKRYQFGDDKDKIKKFLIENR